MSSRSRGTWTRRQLLRFGALSGAAAFTARYARAQDGACAEMPMDPHHVEFTGCGTGTEASPVSPFILEPFTQQLPIPQAMKPGWRDPGGALLNPADARAWWVRRSKLGDGTVVRPGPWAGHQDALGDRKVIHSEWGLPNAGTHQLWPNVRGTMGQRLALPEPILYHLRLQVNAHAFTTSRVLPIDRTGAPVALPPGVAAPSAGLHDGHHTFLMPASTIYGFNGTFPGPMINAEYGRPVLLRVENDLDVNPFCLDRQDFGAPDWAFLTHLHNGHTAAESDGNPYHLMDNGGGYLPGEWMDALYLMHPAGGDDREKQSFLWFHDHRMHHTGPNVYKGMVGLMPHYDPKLDPGDETKGLRLPGVRRQHADGTFDVDYDIPLAFYDCALDDGVTEHRDNHTPMDACGRTRPEWWGQLFYKHHVNHGFVGDVMTVNGVAYPTLTVKRRKYRLRFLGASIARCYHLSLRRGTPMPFPGTQGQWNFGELSGGFPARTSGELCMSMLQIASEGGLLPQAIPRDSVEIWPAKRREMIVDFTRFNDGTATKDGDVLYLTNTLQMPNGRKPIYPGELEFDPTYAVPLLKIVISDEKVADASVLPDAKKVLRASPPVDAGALPTQRFVLGRSGLGGETEWVINGKEFDPVDPTNPTPTWGTAEAWAIENGGGGWTHPMHLHQEEHHVISRDGGPQPDDTGKEDVVALRPNEKTVVYRRFRTFLGNYVGHCHNLAHEDHNMMFGWSIIPPNAKKK